MNDMRTLINLVEEQNSVWYHGTIEDHVSSIKANGIVPGEDGVVWLTKDRDTAFRNGGMRQVYQVHFKSKPVVITLDIPMHHNSTDITLNEPIDPSYIVDIGLTPDELEDYEFSLAAYKRKRLR